MHTPSDSLVNRRFAAATTKRSSRMNPTRHVVPSPMSSPFRLARSMSSTPLEPSEVMIRGYGWKIDHEPLDDYDGGGFYAEASLALNTASV